MGCVVLCCVVLWCGVWCVVVCCGVVWCVVGCCCVVLFCVVVCCVVVLAQHVASELRMRLWTSRSQTDRNTPSEWKIDLGKSG